MAFTENFSDFLDTDEFAHTVVYDGGNVNGIFDAAGQIVGLGLAGQRAVGPQFLCAVADVDANPRGKTVVYGGITYTVADHDPDGTGMTVLFLKRAS